MTRERVRIRWITVAWLGHAILSLCNPGLGATAAAQHAPDRGQRMLAELAASAPNASLGEQARVWDRFVGAWDCDFGFVREDGSVRHARGELDFGWVLDGRAIQDLWITYPPDGHAERGIGTSIRYFDEKANTWRVVFVAPKYGAMLTVSGGIEGDRIVLRGRDGDGSDLRWTFLEIKDDSFTWHGEKSRDGGKSWKLEEEHHMRRRPAGA